MKSKSDKNLCALGRVNEIMYGSWAGDVIDAYFYKLAARESVRFEFKRFCSQKSSTGDVSMQRDNDIPDNDIISFNEDAAIGDLNAEETVEDGSNIMSHRRPSEVAYEGKIAGVVVGLVHAFVSSIDHAN